MPAQLKPVAYETIVRVREDYISGKTVAQIAAESSLSSGLLYTLLAGKGSAAGLPAIKLRRKGVGRRAQNPERTRASLVDRLWRAADLQVREVEQRLHLNEQKPDERERDARVLATTVKTLRDLRALDAARAETEPAAEDDSGPDNLDDFRRELARKMDAIIARREGGAAGGRER